ncbi:YegP family protein [Shewanella frigidimarina]|uniref:YegP family protein n=1 Tax=Shewanella TaxID=22 RepID=UPI003D7A87D0
MSSVSYFYIYKDVSKQWRWKFVAKNGKTISVSSESYHNLLDCEHSVSLMKGEGPSSPVIGDDDFKANRN